MKIEDMILSIAKGQDPQAVIDILSQTLSVRNDRINAAVNQLQILIDGGEECRGLDSALSAVINTLEGKP